MAKRMVNETIVLVREKSGGKDGEVERITPQIGKPFNFTAEEIASIEGSSDTAISKLDAEDDHTAAEPKTETVGGKKAVPSKDTGDL